MKEVINSYVKHRNYTI